MAAGKLPSRKLPWILSLSLLIAASPAARAGQDTWTPFGPSDGVLKSLIASSRGDLYVTASFSTTEIWQRPVSAGWAGTGIESFGVAEMRFHPADSSLLAVRRYLGCICVACDFRTLLSRDGGATFQRLGAPSGPRSFVDLTDLAFDPDSAEGWIGSFGGLALPGSGSLPGVTTVEIGAGGILLTGGLFGLQVSEDDGRTWQTTLDGTFPGGVDELTIAPPAAALVLFELRRRRDARSNLDPRNSSLASRETRFIRHAQA